jgi:hypothetical protein
MTPVQFEHPEWPLPFRRAPVLDRDILGTPALALAVFWPKMSVEINMTTESSSFVFSLSFDSVGFSDHVAAFSTQTAR